MAEAWHSVKLSLNASLPRKRCNWGDIRNSADAVTYSSSHVSCHDVCASLHFAEHLWVGGQKHRSRERLRHRSHGCNASLSRRLQEPLLCNEVPQLWYAENNIHRQVCPGSEVVCVVRRLVDCVPDHFHENTLGNFIDRLVLCSNVSLHDHTSGCGRDPDSKSSFIAKAHRCFLNAATPEQKILWIAQEGIKGCQHTNFLSCARALCPACVSPAHNAILNKWIVRSRRTPL